MMSNVMSKGLKRQLEPDFVIGVQPVLDSDEHLSSPECLLLMQPVEDDYSSDEEARKKPRRVSRPESYKIPGNNPALRKQIFGDSNCSTKFSAAEFLFFMDLDYDILEEEFDMIDFSTVELLTVMFQFISGHKITKKSKTEGFKWKNKSIPEICEKAFKEVKILSWIAEHDRIDFKTSYRENYKDVKEKAEKKRKEEEVYFGIQIEAYKKFLQKLDSAAKLSFDCHDITKSIFRQMQTFAYFPIIDNNGEADFRLRYQIPDHIASNDSNIFLNRENRIAVKPDSVFQVEGKGGSEDQIAKIALEVFCPKEKTSKDDKSSMSLPDECWVGNIEKIDDMIKTDCSRMLTGEVIEIKEDTISKVVKKPTGNFVPDAQFNKPVRKMNGIQDGKYAEQARNFFSIRIPMRCAEGHCMRKLISHHGFQLLCVAFDQLCYMENYNKKNEIISLGMFMKNEYIFFSKLCITGQRLLELDGQGIRKGLMNTEESSFPGRVSYSNWNLDVTKPNHRMALFIFLREYLKKENHPFWTNESMI